MSKSDNLTDFLTDIADAIRAANGTTEQINPQDFSNIIYDICFEKQSLIDRSIGWLPDLSGFTLISNYAFAGCINIINDLVIPDNIETIGYMAFRNCAGFTNLVIPDSVTEIGDEAFKYCHSLTNVTIGSGVTNIGSGAFADIGENLGSSSVTITVLASEPPTIQPDTFNPDNINRIIIPYGTYDSYVSGDTAWIDFIDYIEEGVE